MEPLRGLSLGASKEEVRRGIPQPLCLGGLTCQRLPRAEPPEASGLGAWGESTGYRFRWKLDLGWERAEAENSQPKWDMDVAGIVKVRDGWSLDFLTTDR